MKLTEKEKEQILKNWAEAMSRIIERMSIEMRELEEENKKLRETIKRLEFDVDAWHQLKLLLEWEIEKLKKENEELQEYKSMYEWLCK